MENLIYIKKVENYNDVLKQRYIKMPMILKKVVFMYKNIFNIITKKKVAGYNIWILPFQEKYSINKINTIMQKLSKHKENKYIVSEELNNNGIYKLMDKFNISYLNGKEMKKYLGIKIIEYINNIQNEEMSNKEVTILTDDISEFNVYIIEKISKLVKSIKIVSPNIYKFKNLEEKLYNEYGIALQFSNSYKKSLSKSNLIINLDYGQIDINEYEIFYKAIIINCAKEDIRIKSKLFNGIVINSCNIKFRKEIRDDFKKANIYSKYNSLVLYESCIHLEKNPDRVLKKLEEDKVLILNLIGNNGEINKNEFKNIKKCLTKK